jgi:ribosomal protein S18 acetylase RimI-like enzyme
MSAITLATLSQADVDRVRNLASLPLHASFDYSRREIESRWKDEISELLASKGAMGFVAEIGGTISGLVTCAPLPWESPLVGKSMWAIKHIGVVRDDGNTNSVATSLITEVVRHLSDQDADFLLCRAMPSDTAVIHALESAGFLLMDTLLNFVFDCRGRGPNDHQHQAPEGFALRLATTSDIERLADVAHSAFAGHFGRFHADPRIGQAAATRIYQEWIRSCANGWADWIVVAVRGDRIAGYSAWKRPSPLDQRHGMRLGHYSIGAVHPDFFGRGLFTALTHAGTEQLRSSADWIEAPTHIENYAVQRGFLRLGWRIAGAQHSFHKWLRPPLHA